MIIEITDEMKQKARGWNDKVMQSNIKYSPNYTGISVNDRFYYGYLGELVFLELLKQSGKKYEYTPRFDGIPDDCDFLIYIDGKPEKLDVKTASKNFYKNIMLPKSQWIKKYRDYYIGIRLEGDAANVCGYCKHNDFEEKDTFGYNGVVTMYKSLNELELIEELLEKID